MGRLTKAAIAAAFILTLPGCQSLPTALDDRKVFSAPTYYGKEIPSEFFLNHHNHKSDGHEFRGYHIGPRHWFQ